MQHTPIQRPSRDRHRGPRALGMTVAALASCAALAACGSSSSSSGGGSAATATSGGAASTGGSSASGGSGLAQAKALVAAQSRRPAAIPVTKPIGKPIPKGKTVDFISCGVADCTQIASMLQPQVQALGWTMKLINTNGTPQSQGAAFQQVIRDKANAVIYIGVDPSVYRQYLPQLEANGTWMVSSCYKDPHAKGIDYATCTPAQSAPTGKSMAAYIIADSGGKADSLFVDVPAYPTLTQIGSAFSSTMKAWCSSCQTDDLSLSYSDITSGASTKIVSYLRAHPSVNYVALSIDSLAVGLPAALKAAGLSNVKIVGEGGGDTNWQYIASGEEAASVPFSYVENYMNALDSIVRHEAGVPQVLPSKLPRDWIVDKSNVSQTSSKDNGVLPVVSDAIPQFRKLWGLS